MATNRSALPFTRQSAPASNLLRTESEDSLDAHPLTEDKNSEDTFNGSPLTLDDDYEDDDNAPLLNDNQREAQPAEDDNKPKVEGWASYLFKKTVLVVSSVATAIPNAINALCGTDFNPSDIKTAWARMTTKEKILPSFRSISSLSVNAIMNFKFLPQAIAEFGESIKKIKAAFKGEEGAPSLASEVFQFILANVGSLANALAAFALAFAAFQDLGGNGIATMFAIFNSTVSYAQCFAGMYSIFAKVRNAFDKSAKVQEEAIGKLEALKNEYLAKLQTEIDNVYNDQSYQDASKEERLALLSEVFIRLNTKLFELAPEQYQASHPNYAAKYAGLVFDLAFATLIGTSTIFTFTKTGFDGLNVMTQLITGKKETPFTTMHPILKAAIGAPSGAVSAAFFALHAFEARQVAWEIVKQCYATPKNIPLYILKMLPLAVVNYLSSGGMANVGQQVADDNFLGIPPSTTKLGKAFVKGNEFSGLLINSKTTTQTAMNAILAKPDFIGQASAKPSVQDIIDIFRDTINHPINVEQAQLISSLFIAQIADVQNSNMENQLDDGQVGTPLALSSALQRSIDLESQQTNSGTSQIGMFGSTTTTSIPIRARPAYRSAERAMSY